MARRNQQKPAPEVQTSRVRYPVDGAVEALRGNYFQVPVSVQDKAGWLESQYREEEARQLANREREEREQKVLSDRIDQQREVEAQLPGRVDELEAENAELRRKVERLEAHAATPDAQEQLKINQQTSQLMGTTFEMGQTLLSQAEETKALQLSNAEGIQQWSELKQQTLDVQSNRLDYWNQTQQAASERIRQEEAARAQWNAEAEKWKALYKDGADVIAAAKKVTAASVERQEQLLQEKLQEKADQLEADFIQMVNVVINSLGLTEGELNLTANNIDAGVREPVQLSRKQISYFVNVMRSSGERKAEMAKKA